MKSNRTFIPINLPVSRNFLTLTMGFCLALFASVLAVHAQTVYVSNASGSVSTPTIWTPNGTPGSLDTIEITSGNLVTNTVSQAFIGAVKVDSGGLFALNASMAAGTVTNGGTLNLNATTTGRILTMAGNFVNNGTITGNSSGSDAIVFTNTSLTSLWLGSGDISGAKCGLTVNAGATLDISGLTAALKFRSSGTVANPVNGTLVTGTQVISGNANAACSFTLASGGTLVTANPNGIVNGTSGTLNFAVAPTLNAAANYVFNGTSAQVTTGLPATVNNLTITNAAGVTLSAATTVGGTLALNGGILTTTTGATPTAASATSANVSYVNGPLALIYSSTGAQTFPVGKGGNQRQVTLNYTALAGSSTVTVEQFEAAMGGTPPPGTTQFGTRYWTVSQSGGSGLTYNLSLNGTGFTPTVTPVILQQGTPDTSYSTTFASPNYTASGLTTFGNFTLGDYVPSANQFAFTTSAQTLTAGVTSGTFTVQLQNSGGSPLTTTSNLTLALSTTSGSGVFRDTGDTTTISTVTIFAGNNSASFKYRDTAAPATPTLTASVSGVNPATQIETVNPATASKLAFTTQPANTNLAAKMAPVVVMVQDQYGNPVAQSGTAITLTLNNGGSSVLTGTIPQNTDGTGTAAFNDLAVTVAPGTGLNLTATGGGLTQAISSNFNITSLIIVKALNNNSLNADNSWTGGVQPGTNDTAQIDNTSVSTTISSPDIGGSSVNWYGLNIVGWSVSHGYTINDSSGGNFITLGSGGLTGTGVTHTIAFNCGLALATNEVWNWSGTAGTLTFNGTLANGGHRLTLGGNQAITVSASGTITGAGQLIKQGSNTLTLAGTQTYTGTTVISNGILLVSGSLNGSSAITAAGGKLTGNGSIINSPVTVQTGGTFAPGGGLTTLTINSNLTLQTGSLTSVQVNRDTLASDQVAGINQVNYGGTLVVTNVSGTPQLGDTFTLFSATSFSGNYSGISGSPGAGLAWSFNPANGQLSVVNGTATNPTNITFVVSGNTLTLSWPADHLGWILQSQTNALNVGLTTNWFDVAGSGSATNAVITKNPANPTEFFRLRSP